MLVSYLYLCLSCLTLARSQPIEPIAKRHRDPISQNSVMIRPDMATIIKDLRDGVTTSVERRSLIETTSELDGAVEELRWSLYYFDAMHSDDIGKYT